MEEAQNVPRAQAAELSHGGSTVNGSRTRSNRFANRFRHSPSVV
jgi:hypothetical protein